jgi:hypothetical protein
MNQNHPPRPVILAPPGAIASLPVGAVRQGKIESVEVGGTVKFYAWTKFPLLPNTLFLMPLDEDKLRLEVAMRAALDPKHDEKERLDGTKARANAVNRPYPRPAVRRHMAPPPSPIGPGVPRTSPSTSRQLSPSGNAQSPRKNGSKSASPKSKGNAQSPPKNGSR